MIKKKWTANEENPALIEKLASDTGYDEGLIRILINRKNESIKENEYE